MHITTYISQTSLPLHVRGKIIDIRLEREPNQESEWMAKQIMRAISQVEITTWNLIFKQLTK
jgi:hypothetical protein